MAPFLKSSTAPQPSLDLGRGNAECRFITCDLTAEYVAINADYST
jgi:glutamate N-acetyltransferase/amino-acid N-acetyltransferase